MYYVEARCIYMYCAKWSESTHPVIAIRSSQSPDMRSHSACLNSWNKDEIKTARNYTTPNPAWREKLVCRQNPCLSKKKYMRAKTTTRSTGTGACSSASGACNSLGVRRLFYVCSNKSWWKVASKILLTPQFGTTYYLGMFMEVPSTTLSGQTFSAGWVERTP